MKNVKHPRERRRLISPGRAAELFDTRHESIVTAIKAKKLRGKSIEGSGGRETWAITAAALRIYRDKLVSEYGARPSKRMRAYAQYLEKIII